jgi:hypothetical protein
MLDSFNDQKLAHNEDIRKAIDQIAKEENSIKYSIKDRYWNQFW